MRNEFYFYTKNVNPPSTNRNPFTFKDIEEFNRTLEKEK